MSDCYFTTIKIYNDDDKKLKNLREKIEEWTSKNFVKNFWGNNWLGNIVGYSKIAKWDKKKENFFTADGERVECRGELDGVSLDEKDHCLSIRTETSDETVTSDEPILKMWRLLCDKYATGSCIIYESIDIAEYLYETNNPNLVGKYCVSDAGFMSTMDEKEVVEFLQKAFHTKKKKLSDLLKLYSSYYYNLTEDDYDEENYFTVNEWKEGEYDPNTPLSDSKKGVKKKSSEHLPPATTPHPPPSADLDDAMAAFFRGSVAAMNTPLSDSKTTNKTTSKKSVKKKSSKKAPPTSSISAADAAKAVAGIFGI